MLTEHDPVNDAEIEAELAKLEKIADRPFSPGQTAIRVGFKIVGAALTIGFSVTAIELGASHSPILHLARSGTFLGEAERAGIMAFCFSPLILGTLAGPAHLKYLLAKGYAAIDRMNEIRGIAPRRAVVTTQPAP